MSWFLAVLLMAAPDPTKPFDFAQDTVKQVLTLSTGVVTITVTFVKDLVPHAPSDARVLLNVAWIMFALSIISGVGALLNLTGRIAQAAAPASEGINQTVIRACAGAQLILFALAFACVIYFGVRAF